MGIALREDIRKKVCVLRFENEEARQHVKLLSKLLKVVEAAYVPEMGDRNEFVSRAVYLLMSDPVLKERALKV